MVAELAAMYGKVERGEIDLFENMYFSARKKGHQTTCRAKNGGEKANLFANILLNKKKGFTFALRKDYATHGFSRISETNTKKTISLWQ